MKTASKTIRIRLTSMLLALACVLGVLPASAFAASADSIKLEKFGYTGVSYESAALGRTQLHQMYYDFNGGTTVGFCGTKGGGMGSSLIGQTWGDPKTITDPTVQTMMAYYYAHSTGTFTDEAKALGVNTIWDAGYTWYMNAWVQAIIWRYQAGTLGDPVTGCAEELMAVYNSLEGTHYTSIDDEKDGSSFRSRAKYILDLGSRVWGDCIVYEYSFTGSGSSAHPASSVQKVIIGDLSATTHESYSLIIKKVDSTNPTKGLPGAGFHVEATNGSYSKDLVTGPDGTYKLDGLTANTFAITETSGPSGYEIDNPGPEYVVLPSNGSNTVTVTFTDTPIVTASGSIRKVDADDPSRGLAGSVIEITGVDNNFSGSYTTVAGGALTDVPWDAMPIGSYVAEEVTPPSGYTLSPDPDKVKQEFYWDGKTEVALVFENDAKVKVRLLKLDDANDPLPGCVFNILKDGQVIGSDVTNAAGVITVPNVTEGLYAFVEVSSPSPFAKLTEPVLAYVDQATVEGGGTVNVTAANQRLPNLTLLKLGKKDKTPLPDTVFEIRGIHFGFHTDVTTGADGKAVLTGIPVDSYEVTEKSVMDPYAVSDEASQTVYLGPGDDRQLIFENLKKPLLTLSKSEAGVESFNPIPGTVFLVEGVDSDYRDEWTTGADGTASKYVESGTYQISEKSVPEPFYISKSDAERVEVVSLNPGDEKTVGFQNYRRPLVTVRKENAVTFDPLENAKFQVWWSSNHTDTGEMRDLGTYYTNELGEFTLDVEDGWLKITEVEAPKGFSLPDPATQERFITRGEEQEPFVFQDMPLSAICVWKYDSVKPNVAIENAVFQIRYLSGDTSGTGGTVIGTYRTSSNGSFTVTGCKAGTYIIEELSSDGDHVIDTPPQTVYLSGKEQEVVKVYFRNSPKGSLLVKKVSSDTSHEPLSDVEFFVTDSSGAVLGNNNGKFVTDSSGSFLIEGLDPNTTVVVRETKAKPGYLLDETPQTAVIRAGQTVSLEFRNQPLGSLRILKFARDAAKTPLANVLFKVTYSDGRVVDTGNGKLSSNGLYYTNSDGEILLTGIVGTVVVTEMASIPGYTMDEDTRTQTVVVNPNDTQTLYFYNKPVGGAEIIKVNENDKKERIPDTVFEIRRAGDDALVDTVTTDKNGRVFVTLEDGSYYAVEIESNKKFRLDSTPHYFEVKDGTCEPVVVTNRKLSGILLHKISSADGEGIPGVVFLLYDSQKNPMDQQATDDEGYIYFEDISSGRYYLRELENEGYVPDTQLRTVYVTDGSTTEVEWENTPITGQIQLYKYAAEYNEVTGTAPGTPLANAVYEVIWERSGKVVDYLTTDARGVAASKPLPLGRYKLVEVTAPAYWQVDPTVHDVTLEYAGQIIKLSAYDKPSSLGVTITKRGNAEVLAGSSMRYDFTIANTSNVDLESFFWHDRIPTDAARATVLSTGTYSARLNYRILYKTNYNSTYQVLASNLLTSNNYTFGVNAIPVQAGEVVTDIYFDFGKVPVGFQSTSNPTLTVTVSGMAANGYHLVNRADVGGKYQGTWQTAPASWVTIIRKLTPTVVPKLPKTGY